MVFIFSFFTGKKKSKRASWSNAPTQTSAALVGASSATSSGSSPAQQTVRRQTSRFLSLRTRSSSKMIESPQDALQRQSSIGSLRRKASRRSTLSTTLPKFGFENDEGRIVDDDSGAQMGGSGSTLGLEHLAGPPKLKDAEVAVIYAVELGVDEVKACWSLFGKALRDTGCDTVGLMLPQHQDPDPSTVHHLLALFLLHHQPSLAPSFPSLSTYMSAQSPRPLYSDVLAHALSERPHPHELCEVLKFSLQHLTRSQNPLVSPKLYVDFVRAEHAASYPLAAFSEILLPGLGTGVSTCLDSIFEVFSDIAIKSEDNMMSGGKLCLLLGWWICASRGEAQGDWQKVYREWQVAGQRAEHLFHAWIRFQSARSKLPTRLLELVESYPFGDSTLSSDHLPRPPASSFPRHTLFVHLESEIELLSRSSPRDMLESALRADVGAETPLLAKLQALGTSQEDHKAYFEHVLQLESQAFLKRFPTSSKSHYLTNGTDRRSGAESVNRLAPPSSNSVRSIDSSGHPRLTPLMELSEELGSLASTHPQPKANWDDFQKMGFGDAPEAAVKLDLQLSPRDLPLPLSPSASSIATPSSAAPVYVLKATREERREIDDAFLAFIEECQLDRINSIFSNICLVRLSVNAALEVSEDAPIEWLLLSVEYRSPPRTISAPLPTILRSSSPSKESTMTRKRFSLGGLTSTFRRSSSMVVKADDSKMKKSIFGVTSRDLSTQGALGALEEGSASTKVKEVGGPDEGNTPVIGEMGELLDQAKPQSNPIITGDPSSDTNVDNWHYIAEGGANLVFGYHGSSDAYQNKALRIPKSMSTQTGDTPDLSILWRDELLPRLLSKEYLPDVKPVSLDGGWVGRLVRTVQDIRPDFRTESGDADASSFATHVDATLMDDLRTSSSDISHCVLAVEIKPKWGFLPRSESIHPPAAAAIKSSVSRYTLHQYMRGTTTRYESLDLYSGDEDRMKTAIGALWDLWSTSNGQSNNWRVFVDGKAIGPHEIVKIPGAADSGDVALTTIRMLLPVLHHSGVMQRLRDLQSSLDGTDMSHLAQRFAVEFPNSTIFDPELLPQPSPEELQQFIDLYLPHTAAGKSDAWSLRESIIAYGLSATFKDCSVFVTCPVHSTPEGWKVDQSKATVKVIDLDLKPLSAMKKWYDLDEKIWRHWQDTHEAEKHGEPTTDPAPMRASDPAEEAFIASPGASQLATPVPAGRGPIPSRLANSSTEALFIPTPDRQMHDLVEPSDNNPVPGQGLRMVSTLDASSIRALHSITPDDSTPATPTRNATPTASNPAAMSLPDALFISPSKAMAFADDVRRRDSLVEETPSEDLKARGLDQASDSTVSATDDERPSPIDHLKPDTPKRMIRSAGPSPSPGLAAVVSELPDLPKSIENRTASTAATTTDETQETATSEQEASREDTISGSIAPFDPSQPPASSSAGNEDPSSSVSETDEHSHPGEKIDMPTTPPAEVQQHFRSVLAGIEEESVSKSEPVTDADDMPSTPSPQDQQHFRSILAGVVVEDEQTFNLPPSDTIPTTTSANSTKEVIEHPDAAQEGPIVPNVPESSIMPEDRPEMATSPDLEEVGNTPPFVTPMGFADDVEPTYQDTASTPAVMSKASDERSAEQPETTFPA